MRRKLGRRRLRAQSAALARPPVGMEPEVWRAVRGGGIKGIAWLPDAEIVANIDRWRQARPRQAADPEIAGMYDRIYERAMKRLKDPGG